MNTKRFIIEMGTGVDQHGQNMTEAVTLPTLMPYSAPGNPGNGSHKGNVGIALNVDHFSLRNRSSSKKTSTSIISSFSSAFNCLTLVW